LTFLSNVFVPPSTLPGPLEAFVEVNPISILATASRSLMEGHPDGEAIVISLVVAAALALVFLPVTTRLYRSR
jgi:ABC-2 type transport system permease protein